MKSLRKNIFRCIAIVLAAVFSISGPVSASSDKPDGADNNGTADMEISEQSRVRDYSSYLKYYPGIQCTDKSMELQASEAVGAEENETEVIDGRRVVRLSEKDSLSFEVESESNEFYYIDISYYTSPDRGVDCLFSLEIDGENPFEESGNLSLNRLWADDIDSNSGGKFDTDSNEDEIIPSQKEMAGWQHTGLFLPDSYSDDFIKIYLSEGRHTIGFSIKRENLLIEKIVLHGKESLPTYAEYRKKFSSQKGSNEKIEKKYELEHCYLKSSNGISPYYDRGTPAVTPNSSENIKINAVGGYSWRRPGQWLSWNIDVPENGWYALTFHYQQADKRGLPSVRSIAVDGKVPFKEFENLEFDYSNGWKANTVSDSNGTPYYVYLTEGSHNLKMTVKLGKYAKVLNSLDHTVEFLNAIYRKIIMITGANPDANRDYYLDKEIPDLMKDLKTAEKQLHAEIEMFNKIGGEGGSKASYLKVLTEQIGDYIEDARSIPKTLTVYQSNITVLADILNEMQQQPLALDYLWLTTENAEIPDCGVGLFKRIGFRFKLFLMSFAKDYSTSENGGKGGQAIKIWVSQNDVAATGIAIGRDQAKLLQKMVSSDFTGKTGIHADISLVNSSASLVQAIVSGRNPDIVMFAAENMPVILAARDAAEDLTTYSKFEEIQSRFSPSAMISFKYNDGIYGLPDIQMFYMLYYRQDIFDDLDLKIPETWDEFYALSKKLQHNNLQIGINGSDQTILEMLLLQHDSDIYKEDLSGTCLTDKNAVAAFTQWTELYTHYGLDVAFDFLSRFRSGEMPIGIMPFTMYSSLSASAPEIRGLWKIAPVPGVKNDEGVTVRKQPCSVVGSIILKNAENKEDCFEFLDWWTDEKTQIRFGIETEALLGSSNRYFTANTNAFFNIPWSMEESEAIKLQWRDVTDIYQTPASYYVNRCVTNAFRNVVYYGKNPREILTKYASQMDAELEKKRREFGLN